MDQINSLVNSSVISSLVPSTETLQYSYEMAFYYGKVGLLLAIVVAIFAGAFMLMFG
jgi:hypothetical protein